MGRQVIVLDVAVGTQLTITCAFWLAVPAGLVKPIPNATSSVPPVATVSWGITSAELAAIQAGTVREMIVSGSGAPNATQAAARAMAQQLYVDQQAALNLEAPSVHWIGAFWDGTSWTAAP